MEQDQKLYDPSGQVLTIQTIVSTPAKPAITTTPKVKAKPAITTTPKRNQNLE